MKPLSIRDLQKISAAAIARLPGPVAVRSGDDTVAILTPLKKADPKRIASLERSLGRTLDAIPKAEVDAFFAANPDIEDLRKLEIPKSSRTRLKKARAVPKRKRAS
jgi:hypothetical protein